MVEVDAVLSHANEFPNKIAIYYKNRKITYAEMKEKIEKISIYLRVKGIGVGDYVMIAAPSRIEYVVTYLALHYVGAIVVPVAKNISVEMAEYFENEMPIKLFITDDTKLVSLGNVESLAKVYEAELENEHLSATRASYEMGDVAEILFTTGTTGKPKGAILSYSALQANTNHTVVGSGMKKDDVVLIPVPLNHSFGLRILRTALYNGTTIVLQSGFMFTKELKNNIEKYNCTTMACVPSALQIICQQAGDVYKEFLGKLRYIEFSTGALDVNSRLQLYHDLPNTEIINSWGSTETGGVLFFYLRKDVEKIAAAGIPVGEIQIKIIDENGAEICSSKEHPGRLAMKGDMIMSGYYNNPDLSNEIIKDGWLYTNDLAYLDESNMVYLLGRVDDIINVGGEKVAPIEVEKYVSQLPGIVDCACVGIEDPNKILGQVPILYIVKNEKALSYEEMRRQLGQKMPTYMIPKEIREIAAIPRNYLGKVDRKGLKELYLTGDDNSNEVISCIMSRRSVRSFTEQDIDVNILKTIVEAGRMAPSGHNMQTWRFTVIRNSMEISSLRTITEDVAKKKKTSFYGFLNPKVLVIVSNDRRNVCAVQDSSCAIENMMLAANSFGIGSCWLNSWIEISDEKEIRDKFKQYNIPETHIVYGIVALGYSNSNVKTPAKKENNIFWID